MRATPLVLMLAALAVPTLWVVGSGTAIGAAPLAVAATSQEARVGVDVLVITPRVSPSATLPATSTAPPTTPPTAPPTATSTGPGTEGPGAAGPGGTPLPGAAGGPVAIPVTGTGGWGTRLWLAVAALVTGIVLMLVARRRRDTIG